MTDSDLREAVGQWLIDHDYEPHAFNINGRHKVSNKLYSIVDDAMDEADDFANIQITIEPANE